MNDPNIGTAQSTVSPTASPDSLVGKMTTDRFAVYISSIFALAFFAMFTYKIYLDIKRNRQEIRLNDLAMLEYESIVNTDNDENGENY